MINFYPFPKKQGYHVIFTVIFLLLLLLSRDTLIARNLLGFYETQLLQVCILVLLGGYFLIYNRKNLAGIFRDVRVAASFFSVLCILLPMLLKRDWQLMYLSILFYALTGIFFSYFMTLESGSRYYLVVLTALSLYSVICTYFLRLLPDQGIWDVPVFTNSAQIEFYNFGLSQVSLEYVKNRNFGIFREPGVYQFFLVMGLYLNNYQANWKKNWQLWAINCILALTMLSTFATGGVIEMGLFACFLFVDKKWYRTLWGRILAVLTVIGIFSIAAWILITQNSLYADLVGMVEKFWTTPPSESRFVTIAVDVDIFLHHPLLGEKMGTVLHAVANNATSTMVLLAGMGILAGLLHIAGWAALCWDGNRSVFGNFFLLLILFMSFNTQNLSWNLMFWLFPMMALCQRGLPLFVKKRK